MKKMTSKAGGKGTGSIKKLPSTLPHPNDTKAVAKGITLKKNR